VLGDAAKLSDVGGSADLLSGAISRPELTHSGRQAGQNPSLQRAPDFMRTKFGILPLWLGSRIRLNIKRIESPTHLLQAVQDHPAGLHLRKSFAC
jgi:hypothetical protein